MKHNLKKTQAALDKIGKGFCLAKWTQATLHLGTGLTHSCHHTKAHPINIAQLEKNPSALHNTDRKHMLMILAMIKLHSKSHTTITGYILVYRVTYT